MLILVGVTVSIAINGRLFGTAKDAVRQTQIAEIREQVQTDIAVQGATNLGDITSKQLKAILDKYFTDVPETLPEDLSEVTLTAKEEYGGYKDIPLTDIYNGTLGEESTPTEILVAKDIAENPTKYYGEEVAGYNTETEVNKWRIFYADDTNIYLIADNIISPPKTFSADFKYGSNWWGGTNISSNVQNLENSKARKWIEDFLDVNDLFIYSEMYYMLDTDEWSDFANVDFADYAIGGPTIELYSASYRDTHPDHYLEYEYVEESGYYGDYYCCLLKWGKTTNYAASISIPDYGTDQEFGYYLKDIDSDGFNNIYIPRDETGKGFLLVTQSADKDSSFWCLIVEDGGIYDEGRISYMMQQWRFTSNRLPKI